MPSHWPGWFGRLPVSEPAPSLLIERESGKAAETTLRLSRAVGRDSSAGSVFASLACHPGQRNVKRASLSGLTLCPDVAAVLFDDLFDLGEIGRIGGSRLLLGLPNLQQVVGGNVCTCMIDLDVDDVTRLVQRYLDRSIVGTESDHVVE